MKINSIDVVPKEEAEDLLRPHLPVFAKCIMESWRRWEALSLSDTEFRRNLGTVSRAACVNDHIRDGIKREYAGRAKEGLKLIEKGRLFLLSVSERLHVRYKKMSEALTTSNVRTYQQRLLAFQQTLPGMPDATHVTCGYVLDPLEVSVIQIGITCRVGRQLKWFIPILDSGSEIVVPFAPDSEPPTRTEVRPIAKPGTKAEGI